MGWESKVVVKVTGLIWLDRVRDVVVVRRQGDNNQREPFLNRARSSTSVAGQELTRYVTSHSQTLRTDPAPAESGVFPCDGQPRQPLRLATVSQATLSFVDGCHLPLLVAT